MNNSRSSSLFRFSFAVFDLLCLNMVHFVLMLLIADLPFESEYHLLFLVNNLIWVLCSYITALYVGKHNSNDNFFKRSIVSFALFSGSSLLFIFLYNFSYSRLFVILTYIGFSTTILISRTLYIGAAYYLRKQYPLDKKVVVIGYNELAKSLVENFDRYQKSILFSGYFEDEEFVPEIPIFRF